MCAQVEAYITFIDDTSRDRCIAAQPKSWFKRKLQDKALRFRQQHSLLVTRCALGQGKVPLGARAQAWAAELGSAG